MSELKIVSLLPAAAENACAMGLSASIMTRQSPSPSFRNTTPEHLASVIESKRNVLAYIRSRPKKLTIESYVCAAGLLQKAGWSSEGDKWRKDDQCLPLLGAAEAELTSQIVIDTERLLKRTVAKPP